MFLTPGTRTFNNELVDVEKGIFLFFLCCFENGIQLPPDFVDFLGEIVGNAKLRTFGKISDKRFNEIFVVVMGQLGNDRSRLLVILR